MIFQNALLRKLPLSPFFNKTKKSAETMKFFSAANFLNKYFPNFWIRGHIVSVNAFPG